MTIVVYDRATKLVHVDSLMSYNNGDSRKGYTASKIVRNDKAVLASTGNLTTVELVFLLDIVFAADFKVHTKWGGTSRGEIIVKHTDMGGRTLHIVITEIIEVVDLSSNDFDQEVALGAGAEFYRAFRAIGMDVEKAVHAVALHHPTCGLPIQSF